MSILAGREHVYLKTKEMYRFRYTEASLGKVGFLSGTAGIN